MTSGWRPRGTGIGSGSVASSGCAKDHTSQVKKIPSPMRKPSRILRSCGNSALLKRYRVSARLRNASKPAAILAGRDIPIRHGRG